MQVFRIACPALPLTSCPWSVALLGILVLFLAMPKARAVQIEVQPDNAWIVIVRGFIAFDMNWDQHDQGNCEPFLPEPDNSPQAQNHALRGCAAQSQLGFYVAAPKQDQVAIDAYSEMDFLKGPITGPEEHVVSAVPRLRLAFARFRWNDNRDTLIFGQTYILFGDLYPEITFDNLSLSLGTVLGREPQIQYTHESTFKSGSNRVIYGLSVNAPNSGLFNQATGTAETSGSPFVNAKIAFQTDALGKADYYGFEKHEDIPAQIALSSFYGREKIPRVVLGGTQDVDAWGVALNGVLPIIGIRNGQRAGAASLTAQVWFGEHMDGYFGGNGQGVYETVTGQVAAIRAHGGFIQGKYFLRHNLYVTAQYSFDNNNLNQLTDAGTPFRIASGIFSDNSFGAPGINKAHCINTALWYNPFGAAFFGLVWDSRKAVYNAGENGTNNRINFSMFYNF
jgi:hypothetical protein